ncbi:MAG: PIG-L family deacetylase [Anaerolineae bacterium]|nr:PIG-L family deacetylase [Anaerolineae bacterium]
MESMILKEMDAAWRLLVAFAHPDDESFGPAGTIIHYARQGVAVHYACATRGEAGDVDPELLAGHDSLAELRTRELECAAGHLGLAGLHLLGYRDSGMENSPHNEHPDSLFQAPLEEVAGRIVALIRQIRPQVVITFDPSGGTFHPDHVRMHQATVLAFQAAGDPARFSWQLDEGLVPYRPRKLYYTAFPRRLVKFLVKLMPLFGQDPAAVGRNRDMDLQRIVAVDQVVTAKIRITPYLEASQRAALCHASQAVGGQHGFPALVRRWLFRFDSFTRAVPVVEDGRLEYDLFAGIEEESKP